METEYRSTPLNYSDLSFEDLQSYAQALNININHLNKKDIIKAINTYYSNDMTVSKQKYRMPNRSTIKEKVIVSLNDYEEELSDNKDEYWMNLKKKITDYISSNYKSKDFIKNINTLFTEYDPNVREDERDHWESLKNNITNIFQQTCSENIVVKNIKIINEEKHLTDNIKQIEMIYDPYLSFPEEIKEKRISNKVSNKKSNTIWDNIPLQKFFYIDQKLSRVCITLLENITIMILNSYNDYVIKLSYSSLDENEFNFGNLSYKENNNVDKDIVKFFVKNYHIVPIMNELGMEIGLTTVTMKDLNLYLSFILSKLVEYDSSEDLINNFGKISNLIQDEIIDTEKLSYIYQKLLVI
jgi:hypothetical protein